MSSFVNIIASAKDYKTGYQIASYLRQKNLDARYLKPNVQFSACFPTNDVKAEIEDADINIFILSKKSVKDEKLLTILYWCSKNNLNYFAVYLEDLRLPGYIALQLGSYQAVMLSNFENLDDMLDKVVASGILNNCFWDNEFTKKTHIKKESNKAVTIIVTVLTLLLLILCLFMPLGLFLCIAYFILLLIGIKGKTSISTFFICIFNVIAPWYTLINGSYTGLASNSLYIAICAVIGVIFGFTNRHNNKFFAFVLLFGAGLGIAFSLAFGTFF